LGGYTAKVLLSLPPDIHDLEIYKITGMNAPPLGLAWIASVLEKNNHKVKIIDTPTLKVDTKKFIEIVSEWKPDIIGLSLQTPTAPRGYKIISVLKDLFPDIPIVVGGTHPTYMYEEALNHGADIVVRYEGEYTMLELVDTIERHGMDPRYLQGVKGIAFKNKNKETIVTPYRPLIMNLDELPFPARHLLPMDKYTLFNKPIKIAHVMASRGCPYGCIYCSTSYFWGRRIRFRSAKNVADEIEDIVNKYNVRAIVFTDDELTINKKFMYEFIKEIKERRLDISFACGSRVDHVDKDFLRYLYENGCSALYFGVESASQDTLNKIGKNITVDQAIRVFQWIKELKGFASGSFILGFPWETLDDMKNTIELAIKIDPNYAQFTALTPYPGTPLYEYALKHNLIVDWNWEHYTTLKPVMKGFYFSAEELGKMLIYAYRRFYLRLSFLARELKAARLRDLALILAKEAARYLADAFKDLIK
jgi:magnesium-protoporphyrin IX monomethyl ester (oxidative) cyclase